MPMTRASPFFGISADISSAIVQIWELISLKLSVSGRELIVIYFPQGFPIRRAALFVRMESLCIFIPQRLSLSKPIPSLFPPLISWDSIARSVLRSIVSSSFWLVFHFIISVFCAVIQWVRKNSALNVGFDVFVPDVLYAGNVLFCSLPAVGR